MNSVPETMHKLFQDIKFDHSFPFFVMFFVNLILFLTLWAIQCCCQAAITSKKIDTEEGLDNFWEALPKNSKEEIVDVETYRRKYLGLRTIG